VFSSSWILQVSGGESEGLPDSFAEIITDTRKITGAGTLFVALMGPKFDGHDYVEEALYKGASALVRADWKPEITHGVIRVADPMAALQALAAAWRARFEIPVIGITGSNGKTIVKEMLASILARQFTVYRSPGSFNSQVGVALSLLGIRPEHEVAIIEAGISEVGEMERLAQMIQPTHGILTSIGMAHAAGLHDLATTFSEKIRLFERCNGRVFLPVGLGGEDGWIRFSPVINDDAGTDFWCSSYEAQGASATIELNMGGEPIETRLNAPGAHNAINALIAASMATHLGMNRADISQGISAFQLSPMRLEIHTTSSGVTLINDAYSSDPISARSALATLRFYAGNARKIAILGDMLDLGSLTEEAHRELGKNVASFGVQHLLTLGDRARHIADAARGELGAENVTMCSSLEELSTQLEDLLEPGDVVLFKGSRAMELDRAAERLLESVASTRLYVDLEAIRQNVQALKRELGGARLMAVVKSFAYGNDATKISQTLVREGIDALAVAYADEGVPLRRKGLKLPILVTNALEHEADKIVKYDLSALIYSTEVLDALERHAARRGSPVKVHLEVDTGMGRVGLRPEEVIGFAREVIKRPHVILEGLMTHFASADIAEQDDFSKEQLTRFNTVIADLKSEKIRIPIIHAANTSAAWRMPESRFDMVRVGLGLYGFHPSSDVAPLAKATRPALKFATHIIHIKEVKPGDSVSYGRTWISDSNRRIATIAVGYNDGFPRFMSNGGEVLVRGRRCSVVGTVCMDVCMVDITALPDAELGDEVVLFGAQGDAYLGVEELAARGDTINYEILCKISPRVRRIFLG